jgi:hypothetical protein
MTGKRMALTIIAALVVTELLATIIHGLVLASDYAPYYGSLLRGGTEPPVQMLLLPVAHLCFVVGIVWIYVRCPFSGSLPVRGLKIGVLGWLVGQAPLWMIWYAEQPWPGSLFAKQLVLELVAGLIVGLTIAFIAGQDVHAQPRAGVRVT